MLRILNENESEQKEQKPSKKIQNSLKNKKKGIKPCTYSLSVAYVKELFDN